MKISCIIPTCDRQAFLLDAINSVLAQSHRPDEIIVVNNGKKELELPPEVAKKVRVFRIMAYAGVAQARNFGACISTSDYLAFLDDDDFWSSTYIANVENAFSAGADCVVSRLDKLIDGKVSQHKNANGKITIPELLLSNPGVGGPNTAVRKEPFIKVGGYNPKLPPSEDKSLAIELLRQNFSIICLPDNQVVERKHTNPRLTDSLHIAEGIFQFTRRYKMLMNWPTFFFNRRKFFYYRFKAGYKMALVGLVVFSAAFKISNLFYKSLGGSGKQ